MIKRFIEERKYLTGVSEKTLRWYHDSFRAFEGALDSQEDLNRRVIELERRGVKPVSVNTWLRCIKAYCRWADLKLNVPRLKEEQKVLNVLMPQQISVVLRFQPRRHWERRVHTLCCVILDCGLRIGDIQAVHDGLSLLNR